MTRSAALTVALFALLASPAAGAGGPIAGADAGKAGVTAPGIASRFTALRARGGTLITKVERPGGRTIATRFVGRRLVVPAVAIDGSATGLAAGGGALVLAQPRGFGRRHSEFIVFDTQRLEPQKTIQLNGDFTLDAISPDGDTLFLIESPSRRDPTRYRVRAYDVGAGRLRPGAIVDPAEADEPMRGNPMSRAVSADGRWAYTLYDGGDGPHPFVHALDTVAARAKCIDLDALTGDQSYALLRRGRNGNLNVRPVDGGEPILTIDTRTWQVRRPRPAAQVRPEPSRAGWAGPAAGLVVLALLGAAVVRMR